VSVSRGLSRLLFKIEIEIRNNQVSKNREIKEPNINFNTVSLKGPEQISMISL
jgi:hypothetical protein